MSKRLYIVLLAALLLSALVFSIGTIPSAWAVSPGNASSASQSVGRMSLAPNSMASWQTNVVPKQSPYLQGYREGYRVGYFQGYIDCSNSTPHKHYHEYHKYQPTPYEQGYADGFDKGYQAGFNACNHEGMVSATQR